MIDIKQGLESLDARMRNMRYKIAEDLLRSGTANLPKMLDLYGGLFDAYVILARAGGFVPKYDSRLEESAIKLSKVG